MPAASLAVAKSADSSTLPVTQKGRWAARIGLAVVVAMLVACFGVLIAASRGATLTDAHPADAPSSPAAVSPAAPAR